MEVVSVAAVAENGVIGQGDQLPWDLPHESRQYRERVADDPVVIGRRTYQMFDDPPGRAQIVMSRQARDWDRGSAYDASDVNEALEIARDLAADTLYVLGGEAIYELFLPVVDRQLLSRVYGEYEGDAYYPDFDEDEWDLAVQTEFEGYTLEEWVRAGTA